MLMKERIALAAPCGIDCGVCELYQCRDDEKLFERLLAMGLPKEKLPCAGCRPSDGDCPVLKGVCKTYECVKAKKVEYCSDCADFPCNKLQPCADRAEILPHNMKVFNLCAIKRKGAAAFIEASSSYKKRYYLGKMEIGNGPQVPS